MNLLGLRAGEAKWVGAFAAYLGLVIGVVTVGRTTRDALFLHVVGSDVLPAVYAASAVATVVVAWVWAGVAQRFARAPLNVACAIGSALVLVGLYGASDASAAFAWVLYLVTEAMGALLVMQCWSLLQDAVDVRQAKRVFGVVGAGGQVASIVAALSASELVAVAGVESLLLVGAAGALGAAGLAWHLGRHTAPTIGPAAEARPGAGAMAVFVSPHLRSIAIITVVAGVVVHLVDFQFKSAAAQHTSNDAVALGVFFGRFHAACAAAGLVIQLGLTSRVLQRFGTLGGALPLPIAVGLASLAALLVPGLTAATSAKAADLVLRYSLHDASTQILYLPVPARERAGAKAVIDGVLRPLTGVLAGIGVPFVVAVAGPSHAANAVSAVVLVLVVIWCAAGVHGRRRYLEALSLAIGKRDRDVELGPRSMTGRQLKGPDAVDPGAVADALARQGREAMRAGMDDPRPSVRAGAVLALMRDGGLNGLIVAAEDLRRLIETDGDEERALAAFVLGELRVPSLAPALLEMLATPNERVRRAAVLAIGKHRDPQLGQSLLPLLSDDVVAVDVVRALGAVGDQGLLGRALQSDDLGWSVRLRVVVVLVNASASADRCVPHLLAALAGRTASLAADDGVRRAAVLGLQRLRARSPALPVDVDRLRSALDDEIARAEALLYARATIESWEAPAPAARALVDAIDDDVDRSIAASLGLLTLLHPGKGLEALPRALAGTPVQRANAIEIVDATLAGEHNRRLVSIIEGRRAGPEITPVRTPAERLACLVTGAAPGLACAAAELVRLVPSVRLRGPLLRAATSPRPAVRAAATAALGALPPGALGA